MAFTKEVQKTISEYVENHLPDEHFYKKYFWFIDNENLRCRLEE